jgi:cation:H+ antiporter
MNLWLAFAAASAVILVSGAKLTRYGDIIARKTGLSRLWLGLALMAAVTSLPELASGLSAAAYSRLADIATASIMGSCVFNLFILGLLDTLSKRIPISSKSSQGNIFSAGMSTLLISGAGLAVFLGDRLPSIGSVSLMTPAIVLGYLATMRMAFRFEKRRPSAAEKEALEGRSGAAGITLRRAVVLYAFNAALVVGAAIFLPGIAEGLANLTGLGQTFAGAVFVAVSTSLPELTVSIASVRLGAIDMAVGNIFGSNLFNILILAFDDIAYTPGSLFAAAGKANLVPAFTAVAMTGLAVAGLIYNSPRKRFVWAWDSFSIILLFAAELYVLCIFK